ncbi:MAG: hypothetical protein Q9208_006937 [Pyrenodesmia sp. 3 TL-2023]
MDDHAYGVGSLTTSDDGQSPLSSPDAAQDREATELHEYNNINSSAELNALERTYLGYFRTSLALAFLAVFIAQLFRLQHTPHPDPIFGFFVLGIPLSCICTGAAILVNLLGTYRFWRQQNAILRGKVLSGGWEMMAILGVVLVTTTLLFVLVVAVDITKD